MKKLLTLCLLLAACGEHKAPVKKDTGITVVNSDGSPVKDWQVKSGYVDTIANFTIGDTMHIHYFDGRPDVIIVKVHDTVMQPITIVFNKQDTFRAYKNIIIYYLPAFTIHGHFDYDTVKHVLNFDISSLAKRRPR